MQHNSGEPIFQRRQTMKYHKDDKLENKRTGTTSLLKKSMENWSNFVLAVFGFSFWFFMAIPFASHRESYVWLAEVQRINFVDFLTISTTTYRPLAQAATWLGFSILDPGVFPTSVLRQTVLQGFIYVMFVIAWAIIYSAVSQRRLFSIIALVSGGVFFSGYVHLFHIYGVFYVPIMLILGMIFHFYVAECSGRREALFAIVAIGLVLWHPFATAIFLGFYFGWYLETFKGRSRKLHFEAWVILVVGLMVIYSLVVRFEHKAFGDKLLGFLVSYRTNEVNIIASLVAWLLALITVFSVAIPFRLKVVISFSVVAIGVMFVMFKIPLLLLWFLVIFGKLLWLRKWGYLFTFVVATLLPLGKGIGSPIYVLFSIIIAVFIIPLRWVNAEEKLHFFKSQYAIAIVITLLVIIVSVRAGVEVPIVTHMSRPLLAEREKTYQLEHILDWLQKSEYCAYDIEFVEAGGNPIDSVESAINRRYRPPAGVKNVQYFWNTIMKCEENEGDGKKGVVVIIAFGGQELTNVTSIYEVQGMHAGRASVSIGKLNN